MKWEDLCKHFPGRTAASCCAKYHAKETPRSEHSSNLDSIGSKIDSTRRWTAEELNIFETLSATSVNATEISEKLPGRSADACKRQRKNMDWSSGDQAHLDHFGYTAAEDSLIYLGRRMNISTRSIGQHLPERRQDTVQVRYNILQLREVIDHGLRWKIKRLYALAESDINWLEVADESRGSYATRM